MPVVAVEVEAEVASVVDEVAVASADEAVDEVVSTTVDEVVVEVAAVDEVHPGGKYQISVCMRTLVRGADLSVVLELVVSSVQRARKRLSIREPTREAYYMNF